MNMVSGKGFHEGDQPEHILLLLLDPIYTFHVGVAVLPHPV